MVNHSLTRPMPNSGMIPNAPVRHGGVPEKSKALGYRSVKRRLLD